MPNTETIVEPQPRPIVKRLTRLILADIQARRLATARRELRKEERFLEANTWTLEDVLAREG